MRKCFSLQQTKLPHLKALPGLFVLDEEAIPPGISNTALNCYASRNPSPSPNQLSRRMEIIAVVRLEVLPDARWSQTYACTCTLTPAKVLSLMASLTQWRSQRGTQGARDPLW